LVRVALLEDDEATADVVTLWLSSAGHSVHRFGFGQALLQAWQHDSFDIVLLDWVLPDISGDQVLQRLRALPSRRVPVIFMTQKSTQEDIVRGLNLGADDYMIKPVRAPELLARISAVSRRFQSDEPADVFDRGPFRVNLVHRQLFVDAQLVSLTQKEFDLAVFLLRNAGQIFSRAHLLEAVWGRNASVTTRTVDIHVSRLRKKLKLGEGAAWRLTAIYSHGYRLEPAAQVGELS
jgi:DNA-binding response OmpR family regulator